jgi:hypothetical protein
MVTKISFMEKIMTNLLIEYSDLIYLILLATSGLVTSGWGLSKIQKTGERGDL